MKFIRLAFCDIFGNQKNISVMPRELARAFELGIPFQANMIDGFVCGKENELRLVPDPATMAILPWRPQTGRVVRFFCHIKNLDGSDYEFDARYLLRIAAKRLEEKNLECFIRTECEFYLFQTDEDGLPTKIPHDNATYFDIAPKDKAENVRREICLSLEQMGIAPETSHHQRGPGQNEIVYKYSDAGLRPYTRPSDSENPFHYSLQPDILSCPDKSSHSKMYSENLSQALQMGPSPEILLIHTEQNVP